MDGKVTKPEIKVRRPARKRRVGATSTLRLVADIDLSVPVDPYRTILFPNHLRDLRRRAGYETLLLLAENIPEIPYIRLSKIERGEVVAKAEELRLIAQRLDIDPNALLIDIRDEDFDFAQWSERRGQTSRVDWREEQQAILLAALFRRTRQMDRPLSLQELEEDFSLPPVMVSRIENAIKPIARWNAATLDGICRVIGVDDMVALSGRLASAHSEGLLSDWIARVPGREDREQRTIARVEDLRRSLSTVPLSPAAPSRQEAALDASPPALRPVPARLPVFGSPLPDGLLARVSTGHEVESPFGAGPRAFGLRLCRPTLGPGMPSNSVLVVDPDILPSAGGLAVLREGEALRVVTLMTDRQGALLGYSVNPDREIEIDALGPQNVYAVLAVYFI